MSLKLGTQDISGISQNTKYNAHHLLDFKWADCIMNDVSWLRADTFSWQSGDVYTSAYNHLVADLQGTTAETETIGSYTVTFYRATDGHKICLADQETTVLNIYNETGIAWYYILDTTNTQFKLPRTKYGFEGLRNNVGDIINESLPNITGSYSWAGTYGVCDSASGATFLGAFKEGEAKANRPGGAGSSGSALDFDASNSSATYQDNAPVQERATQMYLYFYVGDYTQTAIEQTAGLNTELFNGKADINLANVNNQAKILISEMAMPSNTYTDLTLGASGTAYIAPANGYVAFSKLTTGANQNITIDCNNFRTLVWGAISTINLFTYMPVKKGDTYTVEYNAGGATNYFRFIYAQGSESEA